MSTQNSTGNVSLPYMVDIDVFGTPKSETNWNTISQPSTLRIIGYRQNTPTQNDEIAWDVSLAAGTWTYEHLGQKSVNAGIVHVYLDGVEVGTIDLYNGSSLYNELVSIAGITIGDAGVHELKLKMETKNGSSSGYLGLINAIRLIRTGA